mgnify:CR=1 FL=1
MHWLRMVLLVMSLLLSSATAIAQEVHYFKVPAGAGPHDVAPAPDGMVWYTAQRQGALGRLDPASGKTEHISLGAGSAPHGVIVGPDGAAWVTDGGLNAIVRVDPKTKAVRRFALPSGTPYTNLNTATFDSHGVLWFTGQSGYYGKVVPSTGEVRVWEAPRGRGPYGITTTPAGEVYYASLAGSHIAHVNVKTGAASVIEPPTKAQGARRVWSDSRGVVWVSEWNSGNVSAYDTVARTWRQWKLPGTAPHTYSVYVDEFDKVWLTEWSANAVVKFDPATERFHAYPSDQTGAAVRQMHGRPGEAWGAESGTDRLVVIRTR